MVYPFEEIKKRALRGQDKSKGKKMSYSTYLFYDHKSNTVVCYRPNCNTQDDRKEFINKGYASGKVFILAAITPKEFRMDAGFPSLSLKEINEYFGLICLSISDSRFKSIYRVQGTDDRDIITPFPATYEYGVGFTSIAPPQMLKFDPEKRKKLNKLIRVKRHMLKTRAKLGASFSLTPENMAKNIKDGVKYIRPLSRKEHIKFQHSPYLSTFFFTSRDKERAKCFLDLLKAAKADSMISLTSLINCQQFHMLGLNLREIQKLDNSPKSHQVLVEILTATGSRTGRNFEELNNKSPMEKYKSFENRLAIIKPALRQIYGADYYENATQTEAKEALDLPV